LETVCDRTFVLADPIVRILWDTCIHFAAKYKVFSVQPGGA